jgi:serine/threonine-protein kinase
MGNRIGQYEIQHELGSGGFGTVYAAIDTELGRRVAIKALKTEGSANPSMVERFRAEAISLARLNHPNITILYTLLHPADEWYLVMELVQGQTLDKVIYRQQRLGLQESLAIIAQAASGLGYANRMGIIHRDIKPSNLMLADSGQLKIMDFGIARIRGTQRLTRSGLAGTYAYLAPEQFRGGEGSERSDLYALACVFYEMLSGNIPFDAPTEAEMMRGHLELPPRPLIEILPNFDANVNAAILKALGKNPEQRFASIEAFADAVGASAIERQATDIVRTKILSRMPPPVRPTTLSDFPQEKRAASGGTPGSPVPGRSSKRSNRLPLIAVGASMVAAVGAIAVAVLPDWSSHPRDTASSSLRTETATLTTPVAQPVKDTVDPSPTDDMTKTASAAVSPSAYGDRALTKPPSRDGNFLSNQKTEGDSLTIPLSPTHESSTTALNTGETMLRRARELEASGDVSNAEVLLRKIAESNSSAWVELAHLEDPTEPTRPSSTPAHPSAAARYYQEAEAKNAESAHADRERLRQFLQSKANAGDYSARAVLQQYWP